MTASRPARSPSTRWTRPPPWQLEALARPARRHPPAPRPAAEAPARGSALRPSPRARPPQGVVTTSGSLLLALVRRDLGRGHMGLAARHLLMLEACGHPVPEELRRPCESWLRQCPSARRSAIAAQVGLWADMVLGPAPRRKTWRTE